MYKIIPHPNNLKFIEFYNQNNFHVILSNYGASIYEIDTIDRKGQLETVTLSPLMVRYFHNPRYYGLSIGRVAGRIKDAKYEIDGVSYHLPPNEHDNLLHSGERGTAYRFFDFEIKDSPEITTVTFSTKIKDMEDGFPGDLDFRVVYSLSKFVDELDVRFLAMSSKDTWLNITNHSYFNLSGNLKSTIDDQIFSINKEKVGLMDDELIVSEFADITPSFDFRTALPIKSHLYDKEIQEGSIHGYDHIFSGNSPLRVTLYDKKSGRFLEIDSDYKDCVIYTNNTTSDAVFPNSVLDKPYLGMAIEPCRYSKIMGKSGLYHQANALYDHTIRYQFSVKEEDENASENH